MNGYFNSIWLGGSVPLSQRFYQCEASLEDKILFIFKKVMMQLSCHLLFSTLCFLCFVLMQISETESQKKEAQRKESHTHTQNEVSAAVMSQSDCFTQRNSLFNKEVQQVKCSMHTKPKPTYHKSLFIKNHCTLLTFLSSIKKLEINKYLKKVFFFQNMHIFANRHVLNYFPSSSLM